MPSFSGRNPKSKAFLQFDFANTANGNTTARIINLKYFINETLFGGKNNGQV
jgi:hypothetical protein